VAELAIKVLESEKLEVKTLEVKTFKLGTLELGALEVEILAARGGGFGRVLVNIQPIRAAAVLR
jgi:hypothetical protein